MIKTILKSAFGVGSKPPPVLLDAASIPEGQRVYAIGDVHGRLDLLHELLSAIKKDAAEISKQTFIVYLGDYVDRGHDSRGIIDFFLNNPMDEFEQIFLMGNHEEFMLRFMESPGPGAGWLEYGGMETLLSYGVSLQPGVMSEKKLSLAADGLREMVPQTHIDFLSGLKDSFELGDFFFCHAGIDPDRPLSKQKAEDLRWAREPFLSHTKSYSKIIVHGHSITERPELHPNRISIDTGAYHSGQLTCLVLHGKEKRFIQTPIK